LSCENCCRRRDFDWMNFFLRTVRFGAHHATDQPFGIMLGTAKLIAFCNISAIEAVNMATSKADLG
jgi:hypothetical protein